MSEREDLQPAEFDFDPWSGIAKLPPGTEAVFRFGYACGYHEAGYHVSDEISQGAALEAIRNFVDLKMFAEHEPVLDRWARTVGDHTRPPLLDQTVAEAIAAD